MSIAIHHGPSGSYKTFGIIQRHVIDALKAGRVVVTNIRGFDSIEAVIDQYPEIEFPVNAQILTLPQKDPDCLELIRRWWHWVPFGALVVIDEAQMVYPKRRDFRPKSLDTIESRLLDVLGLPVDITFNGETRPANMEVAFDMHRHFNWDMFLSTPNIGKIHPEIRQSAEWAYRHRDLSTLLPWLKGKWVEIQHDAEFSGKSISHVTGSPTRYKADPRVWKCYKSTATGQHSDSIAGRSIFKDPKILALSTVVFLCIIIFAFTISDTVLFKNHSPVSSQDSELSVSNNHNSAVGISDSSLNNATANKNSSISRSPPARSVSEHSAGGELALFRHVDINGYSEDDYQKFPPQCRVSTRSIKCPVTSIQLSYLRNTYCLQSNCYAVFYPTPKQLEETQKATVDYKPLNAVSKS